ncbi:MAG: GGDEF domain-containing protein [Clostridia bacterium]|nr:GGDEF domain-containing protein [Clostridia bacterium]
MSLYARYYLMANIACVIIFGIILFYGLLNENRRERQIKYDYALVAFMGYFIFDTFWAMVIDGVVQKTLFTVILANVANYLCMASITHFWLEYTLAVLHHPNRNKRVFKLAHAAPFIVSTVALVQLLIFARETIIDGELMPTALYFVFLIAVPCINIGSAVIYAFGRAFKAVDPIHKKRYFAVGVFPILVVTAGLLQTVLVPDMPMFCLACAITMVTFNIQMMQTEISTDSLTGLNNRGELQHFVSQFEDSHSEGNDFFVVMMDVNDFKLINDNFGHAEGDRALITISKALKDATRDSKNTLFLGRYGGDEFIMIIKADGEETVDALIAEIRENIASECEEGKTPYMISVSAGYDRYSGQKDSFRDCVQQADKKLYLNKEEIKEKGNTTMIRK